MAGYSMNFLSWASGALCVFYRILLQSLIFICLAGPASSQVLTIVDICDVIPKKFTKLRVEQLVKVQIPTIPVPVWVKNSLFNQRMGFAKDTTGGGDGRLFVVTSTSSLSSTPGSLPFVIQTAKEAGVAAWIIFHPALDGDQIVLLNEIKLLSNSTIDGRCGQVELRTNPEKNILAIRGTRNIILTHLKFSKPSYVEGPRNYRDAISVMDGADLIWINRNHLSDCGDGCVDVVFKKRPVQFSRVTISNNRFENTNKTILIGSLFCSYFGSARECQTKRKSELVHLRHSRILVSVDGNYFKNTSQRNPKVYSHACAIVTNNRYELRPTIYQDGKLSAVYGIGADRGGIALVGQNSHIEYGSISSEYEATWQGQTGYIRHHEIVLQNLSACL